MPGGEPGFASALEAVVGDEAAFHVWQMRGAVKNGNPLFASRELLVTNSKAALVALGDDGRAARTLEGCHNSIQGIKLLGHHGLELEGSVLREERNDKIGFTHPAGAG